MPAVVCFRLPVVSTHSRPKAAGTKKKATLSIRRFQHTAARRRLGGHQRRRGAYQSFNTQPPEGGWRQSRQQACADYRFNTQPPEGGWVSSLNAFAISVIVSTHSRPKAAGGRVLGYADGVTVSTHSRPKAAGPSRAMCSGFCRFQHTAARRRLGLCAASGVLITEVSTHSRPKAAGLRLTSSSFKNSCFNTQPPEGGWFCCSVLDRLVLSFQHTAARRRLVADKARNPIQKSVSTHSRPKAAGRATTQADGCALFQHTAARRRLVRVCAAISNFKRVSTHSRPKAAGSSWPP